MLFAVLSLACFPACAKEYLIIIFLFVVGNDETNKVSINAVAVRVREKLGLLVSLVSQPHRQIESSLYQFPSIHLLVMYKNKHQLNNFL